MCWYNEGHGSGVKFEKESSVRPELPNASTANL